MSKSNPNSKAQCCAMEKKQLMKNIASCDYCSTSWEEHHRCLSRAAKESGKRARQCIIA